MARRLKVKPIEGELGLRFEVESRSNPEHPNIVDLSNYDGWGQCWCKHWQCDIGPIVKKQSADRLSDESTCAHVRAAFRYFSMGALTAMIKFHGQDREED